MSLINDALKKAQKQRTGDAPELNKLPSIGGEPAARIAKRGKPPGFNSLLLWIGLGATTFIVLIVGGFFIVRALTAHPETTTPIKPAAVAQTTPVPVTVTAAPAATVPSVSTSGTASVPPATTVQAPTPVVVAETKPVAVVPVVLPPPEPEVPKPAAPVGKMESKAVAYIEALRVAGIRASATDSKVLMNDRVYRTGDTIEHQLGLKLAVITASSLTFEDEKGARYTRNF
jgi:hypothetical protein